MIHTIRPARRGGRVSQTSLAVCAGGVGIALVLTMASGPLAAAADTSGSGVSPATASDAPFTKTVSYLLSQMTPAEEVAVIEKGTDPDPHGEAGYLAGVPRLGVPAVRHADALGINVYADGTGFPGRLGLASSFDRDAYNLLGEEVGKQGKALGVDLVYGPQVDMSRYPSWSRNLTTNGEDSYVSSQFSAAEINGIQSQGLMSQVKHVSFYNGQNQATPSLISSQAAHEVYLAPAQSAIQEGGVSSLMCSYAIFQIVGEQDSPQYACSNSNLLNNIVKNQFGLKGFITSDYTASKATSDILAGMDNEFASSNLAPAKLIPLIDLTSSSFDPAYATATATAVARMVYEYERFGLLDNSKIPAAYQSAVPQHGNVASTYNGTSVDKASGAKVALQLAEESGVLLKNSDSTLPLSKSKTVAVVGPTGTLLPSSPGGERSRGFGDQNNNTPVKAMKATAGTNNVVSAPGIDWIGTTVPATALSTDDAGVTPGLTRTGTDANNAALPATTDLVLDGKQTTLVKGNKYTWTGYINVPTSDTYQLLLQRPYGTDSGVATAYNGGVRPAAAGAVTLSVDNAPQTLAAPSAVILQNDFPDGTLASNGQYLGKDNTGVSLALTAGRHQVSFTYNPLLTSAQTPTLRFAWAPLAANTAAAVTAAQTSDETVIFTNSENAGSGPSSTTSAGLAVLPANQLALINTVAAAAHAAGHKVAVVVNSGSAVQLPFVDSVDAVLEMWYPGEQGGKATANLLYGDYNPSGKLPITFPKDDASTPFAGHDEETTGSGSPLTIKWSDGVDVGYRWYTDPAVNTAGVKPLYPFGFGLSYTSFDYSGLSVKNAKDGGLDVTFTVKNTGTKDGADSPQVYLGASPDLKSPVLDANGLVVDGFQQSAEKLVQFDHVELAAGASTTQTLHIDVQSVSAWDTKAQKWVVGSGARSISLGSSSVTFAAAVTKNVVASVTAPSITTNPASTSAVEGTAVTFTAAASGTPTPSVQWQVSTDKGTTWNDVAGATSTSYSFTAVSAQNGSQLRAVFTNDLGVVPTAAAALTVTHAALTAPAALKASGSVKVGKTLWDKSKFTLSWTASTPATSLRGYQVLDGSKVIAAVPAGTTKAALALKSGTHKLSVRALASDPLVRDGDKTSATLSVKIDRVGPVVKVSKPSKSKVTGTARDAGVGSSKVAVKVIEKRGSKYYYYTGSKFIKATSEKAALSKAKSISAKVKANRWSIKLHAVKSGTIRFSIKGTDKVGNVSAPHASTFRLK